MSTTSSEPREVSSTETIDNATPTADRVPLRAKMAWALGSLGDNYAQQTITMLAGPVYNITLGLPADKLASALSIPRWIDSFADPTVGYLSDNAKTRWGRRRPFIAAGAIPLAIMAYCLWLPGLNWSHASLVWFISGISLLYYLAYALFIVPYRALGFELTRDYNERTRVQGWGMIFGLIGGQGLGWLPKLALVFGGANAADKTPNPEAMLHGVRWVGLAVGLIILVTCAAPAFLCRERTQITTQEKISIWTALKETLKSWPFFNMLLSRTLVLISTIAVSALTAPLAIQFLYGGNQSDAYTLLGLSTNFLMVGAGIGIPFNSWMSAKIGKRHAFIVCLAVAIAGCLSQAITYQPAHPKWTLASQFILGFGLQGVWLMCQSIVADVCDEDEIRTGRRREGLYGATYALLEKLGITAGIYVGGIIATLCGYSAGISSEAVLHKMWLAIIVVPVIGMILSAALIFFYPLTHERMIEIRRRLDARKTAGTAG